MLAAAVSLFAVMVPASRAVAHGGAEGTAKELVLTAIAIIQTQPNEHAAIEDKLHDAMTSDKTAGIDVETLRRADEAFRADDLRRTQLLLQQSVHACPGLPILNVASAPRVPAGLALCPSPSGLKELSGGSVGGTEGFLLGIAAVILIALGATVAIRIH
jgi:hypothetical protein